MDRPLETEGAITSPEAAMDGLHSWATSLLDDALDRRRGHEGQWWENIATYAGDLWAEWHPHDRKLIEAEVPDYKVRLPINLAQPAVRTELAKLTKNRPIVDVVAKSNDKTDLNAADVGDKIMNNYAERQFKLPRVRRRMLHWTLICGMGGIFVDYDETLNSTEVLTDPRGNPVFDQRAIEGYKKYYEKMKQEAPYTQVPEGDLVIKPVSPFQVVWEASSQYLDDSWWVIYSDVFDTAEIERRWGVEVDAEANIQPGVIEKRILARFDKTNKIAYDTGTSSQDMARVHRLFVKPGHPYFPNGLELVFTEQEVIKADSFPHDHGELPISMMGHIPMPVGQSSLSVLQAAKPVVLEISRTASQMIENRNLMTNPPWLIPEQVRLKKEIQNRPGMRLKYQFQPNIPEPHPVQMPDLPGYVRELIPMMKEQLQDITGQGETSQGRIPPGARSGVAIAYLQEEDDTRLGPTIAEFEETLERSSGQILSLMAQNYNTPRTIQIYKKHSAPEVFDFVGTMLAGVGQVKIQAGSALPRSKAAKQQYILDLWDRRLEQDPRRVREMLELAEGEPEDWEVDMDQAERENSKMMNGTDVEVEEWFNHAAHHYTHRRFMKSADFEALDRNIQDIFRAHDEEHTMYEREIQARQAQEAAAQMGAQQNGALSPQGSPGAAANGQNVPEGAPAPFSSQTSPRDLMDQVPQ